MRITAQKIKGAAKATGRGIKTGIVTSGVLLVRALALTLGVVLHTITWVIRLVMSIVMLLVIAVLLLFAFVAMVVIMAADISITVCEKTTDSVWYYTRRRDRTRKQYVADRQARYKNEGEHKVNNVGVRIANWMSRKLNLDTESERERMRADIRDRVGDLPTVFERDDVDWAERHFAEATAVPISLEHKAEARIEKDAEQSSFPGGTGKLMDRRNRRDPYQNGEYVPSSDLIQDLLKQAPNEDWVDIDFTEYVLDPELAHLFEYISLDCGTLQEAAYWTGRYEFLKLYRDDASFLTNSGYAWALISQRYQGRQGHYPLKYLRTGVMDMVTELNAALVAAV